MKTINDLREILSEEIDLLRAKKTTPQNLQAIVNATGKFLTSAKIEMEYAKMLGKQPKLDFIELSERKL